VKRIAPVVRPDRLDAVKESLTSAAARKRRPALRAFLQLHEHKGFSALLVAGSGEEHSDPMRILCKVSEQRIKWDCFWTDRLLCSLMEGVN
jgi:hypothetical protein